MRGNEEGRPAGRPIEFPGRVSAGHSPERRNSGWRTALSWGRLLKAGSSGDSNHSSVNSSWSMRLMIASPKSLRIRVSRSSRRQGPSRRWGGFLQRSRYPACRSPTQPRLHETVQRRSAPAADFGFIWRKSDSDFHCVFMLLCPNSLRFEQGELIGWTRECALLAREASRQKAVLSKEPASSASSPTPRPA